MPIDSSELKSNYKAAEDHLSPIHREMTDDFKFYALKQWPEEVKKQLSEKKKPALVFDMIRASIHTVTGAEMTDRYMSKFEGFNLDLEENDRLAAELFNKLYSWARSKGETEHEESLAFADCVVCGYGATDTSIEYHRYSDGQIMTKRIPVWNVGWDPSSIEPNMQDARWMFFHKTINEKTFLARFGKRGEEVLAQVKHETNVSGASRGRRIRGRQYDEGGATTLNLVRAYDPRTRTLRIFDYQYYEEVKKNRVTTINPETGDRLTEWVLPGKPFNLYMAEAKAVIAEKNGTRPEGTPEFQEPEVREGLFDREFFRVATLGPEPLEDEEAGVWEVAESPYRIKDQKLKSLVYVRVIDRGGNTRVTVFKLPLFDVITEPFFGKPIRPLPTIGIGIVLLLTIIWVYRVIRRAIIKRRVNNP